MPHVKKFPKIDYLWTEGDTKPKIGFTLPSNRQVADETVTLTLRKTDGTVVTIAATDLGGSNGQFDWGASDLIEGSGQMAQIKAVDAGGLIQTTETFLIDVQERVS
jgi:hypothetical protein